MEIIKPHKTTTEPVIVVGGGWAGLSAAVELARAGEQVLVLEAAKQLGGRARRAPFDGSGVDNGQHMMLGAYHNMLEMLDILGQDTEKLLWRAPLRMAMRGGNSENVRMQVHTSLPAPWHLLHGIVTARGLSIRDRLSALLFSLTMALKRFHLQQDMSVESLLDTYNQSERLVSTLWEPLCLGALNTHLPHASANAFLNVLNRSFADGVREDADIILARTDLGKLFPDAAMDYIEQRNGMVRFNQRVSELVIENERVRGVQTRNGDELPCRAIILAVPHIMALRLTRHLPAMHETTGQLLQLRNAPIVTVYLRYPEHVALEHEYLGLVNMLGQWVFDRRFCGQPGVMAVVISGEGPHMELDNTQLAERIHLEIHSIHPDWPEPEASLVIREKNATFTSTMAAERNRPANRTAIEGLWLAGDYTATGLPATLEGAVLSGRSCARQILGTETTS